MNCFYLLNQSHRDPDSPLVTAWLSYLPRLTDCVHHHNGGSAVAACGTSSLWENQSHNT